MTDIITSGVIRAVDANGAAIPGAKAYFYQSGTNTPVTVYANATATTPHATPVVADGSGVFPPIYTAGNAPLKMNVTTALGAAVPGYPLDPVALYSTTGSGASSVSFSPITGNGATNVQQAIQNIQTPLNTITPAGWALLDDANAAAMRATLGISANGDLSLVEAADANNATKSGAYRLQNTCANLPSVNPFECFVSSPNGTDVAQVAIRATDGQMWRRIRTGGAWTAWAPIIDTGNIDSHAKALGVGQTMQSPSRLSGTTYQNTTGRPIFVVVGMTAGSTGGFQWSNDGTSWNTIVYPNSGTFSSAACIIPQAVYYRVLTVGVNLWMEVRA